MAQKIPLTLGFANLSGDDLAPIASEDVAALSPLFENTRVVPPHQAPSADVLFLYVHLNEDGSVPAGQRKSSVRQIAELTKSKIVVVASPNSGDSIKNAGGLPGPRVANIVFTLSRNGKGFAEFFYTLFDRMRGGESMLSAWVKLAPQSPNPVPTNAPGTILLAEAGNLAFPK
ncbi:MAG TPA: hypothetical protein VMH36_20030 [Alphaproteobacteria bacterium]|nr:hypothetical protein [Alphaproteobacteria bacterium]